jgi:hypothetical protein
MDLSHVRAKGEGVPINWNGMDCYLWPKINALLLLFN